MFHMAPYYDSPNFCAVNGRDLSPSSVGGTLTVHLVVELEGLVREKGGSVRGLPNGAQGTQARGRRRVSVRQAPLPGVLPHAPAGGEPNTCNIT